MNIQITPVDKKREEEGEWAVYRGVSLLIARANNVNFRRAFKRLSKPFKTEIDNDRLDEETSIDIGAQTMAETILLDWKDFPGDIEYSIENAKELLINDPDCYLFVKRFSENLDNYLIKDREDTAGK